MGMSNDFFYSQRGWGGGYKYLISPPVNPPNNILVRYEISKEKTIDGFFLLLLLF